MIRWIRGKNTYIEVLTIKIYIYVPQILKKIKFVA